MWWRLPTTNSLKNIAIEVTQSTHSFQKLSKPVTVLDGHNRGEGIRLVVNFHHRGRLLYINRWGMHPKTEKYTGKLRQFPRRKPHVPQGIKASRSPKQVAFFIKCTTLEPRWHCAIPTDIGGVASEKIFLKIACVHVHMQVCVRACVCFVCVCVVCVLCVCVCVCVVCNCV